MAPSITLPDEEALNKACEREKLARSAGLPAIGSRLVNHYGIDWTVRGHAALPTIQSLGRWRKQSAEEAEDLYPVIVPANFSPRLLEFMCAIDRCTTRRFALLDTMPDLMNRGHIPGGNSIDTLWHPEINFLLLDAARVHETIIAHEFGHAWVEYVDECEDRRTFPTDANPARLRLLNYVQSFVLDLKVNDVLRRKGFDMFPVEQDEGRSIASLTNALAHGYQPEYPGEEVFMSQTAATELIRREQGISRAPAKVVDPIDELARFSPPMARLARKFASIIQAHGYDRLAGAIAGINECLLVTFAHCGEPIDLDRDLIEVKPNEPDIDKFPEWLSPLCSKTKCRVGKHMAINDIDSTWRQSLESSVTGRTTVQFLSPDGLERSQMPLHVTLGPPTRYSHLPEAVAESLAHKIRNRTGDLQLHGGLPHDLRTELLPMVNSTMKPNTAKTQLHPPTGSTRNSPGPFVRRPYMAGTARFLTMVREAEHVTGEAPYRYALSNPTTYFDPWGLDPCTPAEFEQCWSEGASGCVAYRQIVPLGLGASCTVVEFFCTGSNNGRRYRNCRALQAACYASFKYTTLWQVWQWRRLCDDCYDKCKRFGVLGAVFSGCDFWNRFHGY